MCYNSSIYSKIRSFSIIIMLMLVVAVTGCNESGSETKIDEDTGISIMDKMISDKVFAAQMCEVDGQVVSNLYQLSDSDTVVKSYMGTGASAEEITFIKSDDTSSLKKKASNYIASRTESFLSYSPEEAAKLEKSNITVFKNYVLICVSNDTNKAKKIVDEYTK